MDRTETDRRQHPRLRCCVVAEVWPEGADAPLLGTMANINPYGCYVQTTVPLGIATRVDLKFSVAGTFFSAKGAILGTSRGFGVRIGFIDDDRRRLKQLYEAVEKITREYDSEHGYLARLRGR
jgi:hypothetical protein